MPNPIGASTLNDLVNRSDRNRNGRLDRGEGDVYGRVQGPDRYNDAAATQAIAAGDAALVDVALAPADALEVANRISGGDAWVSQQNAYVSDAARQQIDGLGGGARDGRISRTELAAALQTGRFAVTHDGIFLSSEARARYASAPVPPAVNPLPPAVDPLPPVVSVAPAAIAQQYLAAHQQLSQVYNATSMTSAEYQAQDLGLARQAFQALLTETRPSSYTDRKAALSTIYNASPMGSAEETADDRQLMQDAVQQLMVGTRGEPYGVRKQALSALYNASPMTSDEENGYDQRLIQEEVQRIAMLPASPLDKADLVNQLYNASSMTSEQRDAAYRQVGAY